MTGKTPREITSLPLAILDYFGKLPSQETASFMLEIKALTDADRAEFRELLRQQGYSLP